MGEAEKQRREIEREEPPQPSLKEERLEMQMARGRNQIPVGGTRAGPRRLSENYRGRRSRRVGEKELKGRSLGRSPDRLQEVESAGRGRSLGKGGA